ncbi:MAG: hypothetical protein AVDCRST_MAG93-8771 [uncultured Chloroflexia bacterium]|uniref:Uncharacterized protein n=1 Tax=uncultured Chloroflexia bacterium TaxID=1672391 RepID=A0A6J4N3I6_9CHLR|nr:MAG: hypothetical protein AVDCRST_MAG93-8771 [uncultured Chloroflexia bacterium]
MEQRRQKPSLVSSVFAVAATLKIGPILARALEILYPEVPTC